MNSSPTVSIIVPFYDSPKYFNELLQSIDSQTVKDIELIIIDDDSNKESQDKLNKIVSPFINLSVTIFHIPVHKGAAFARNEGMRLAKGKYITFIDADDMLCGRYSLEYRIKFLENNQNITGVAGYPLMIDGEGKIMLNSPDNKIKFFQKAVAQPENLLKIYCENLIENTVHTASTLFFLAGSSLFRREDIADIHLDPQYEKEEDVEWLIRFLQNKSLELKMIPFHYRRVHDKQYHLETPSQMTQNMIEISKKILKI